LLDTSWGSGHLVEKPCYIVFQRTMNAFFQDCLKQVIEDLLKLLEERVSTDYEDGLLNEVLALFEWSVGFHVHGLLEIPNELLSAPLLAVSTCLQ